MRRESVAAWARTVTNALQSPQGGLRVALPARRTALNGPAGRGRTAMGGNSLYIEAACVERGEGKAAMTTTGARGGARLPAAPAHSARDGPMFESL